ncbi:head protein [Stigmatella erecta]|uniref:Uncharacterized protein n=1 Tax=Stigmatella erecta TaxID=83460 RepID=A0A1I0KY03_9BACT|nr:head protein [Stigmatella erecta]SEU31326.1 hypothetical protein SAMN05443639_11618 [Stigmatella erecta]
MKLGELSLETQELLGQHREAAHSAEEKERFLVAMDALKFIAATGQSQDFEDYRKSLDTHAPPLVLAAFGTREEAEAWLNGHAKPPHLAYVLIAGAYHVVMHVPDLNHRRLISHPVLEFYLAEMIREGIPAPMATFHTQEEARTWLEHQSEPPRQVFIHIGGEPHLVAYHHRIGLRAMYPLSMAAPLKQADE